jgi:hypothetical protein
LSVLRPLFNERKNFSILTDDWYIHPPWYMQEAEFLLFRKYNGLAVRMGDAPFLTGGQPPLLLDPRPDFTKYPITCAAFRPLVIGAAPFFEARQRQQQRTRPIDPSRLLYFPFAIEPSNVPMGNVQPIYDFANTGGVLGIWIMRDVYAPFRYSFANLYHDRRLLTEALVRLNGKPFATYDCMVEGRRLSYADYTLKNHQSRYLVASGGLHDATVPKFTEYACVGTPMIGRALPYEYPWLDDCLFPVDMMNPTEGDLKPLLHQALDRYPKMRENCLNWRDRLLQLYELQNLLDMVQEQADGKPIRPGYLKKDLKHPATRVANRTEPVPRC